MSVYTADQVSRFYERINLPKEHCHSPDDENTKALLRSFDRSYAFLSAIMRYMLASIPFENLSLHYSPHQAVNISPAYLYHKIVAAGENRGGYCMENNTLLLTLLRSIGFDVYGAGARINESVSTDPTAKARREYRYGGWSHMVLLVSLPPAQAGGSRDLHLVDVGFGAGGPTSPLRLAHGVRMENIPGRDGDGSGLMVRLVREQVAQTSMGKGPSNDFWIFERRIVNSSSTPHGDDDEAYRPFYCFTEMEFFPEDFAVVNLGPSTSKRSIFTQQVLCLTKILSQDGSKVIGDTIIWGKRLTRKTYCVEEFSRELHSEEERLQALKDLFNIKLADYEKEGIKGMASMIPG